MIDLFKKGFYLGLGTGVMVKESLGKSAEEVIAKGKMTSEQSKEAVDEMMQQLKSELEKIQEKGEGELDRYFGEAGLVSKKEFEALEKRVAALETLSKKV